MYVTAKWIIIFGENLKGLNKNTKDTKEIVVGYRENGEKRNCN
jgi:hypothetical protein